MESLLHSISNSRPQGSEAPKPRISNLKDMVANQLVAATSESPQPSARSISSLPVHNHANASLNLSASPSPTTSRDSPSPTSPLKLKSLSDLIRAARPRRWMGAAAGGQADAEPLPGVEYGKSPRPPSQSSTSRSRRRLLAVRGHYTHTLLPHATLSSTRTHTLIHTYTRVAPRFKQATWTVASSAHNMSRHAPAAAETPEVNSIAMPFPMLCCLRWCLTHWLCSPRDLTGANTLQGQTKATSATTVACN